LQTHRPQKEIAVDTHEIECYKTAKGKPFGGESPTALPKEARE
jgi:hypothetical protein